MHGFVKYAGVYDFRADAQVYDPRRGLDSNNALLRNFKERLVIYST